MNNKMMESLKNKPIKLCAMATASKDAKPWNAVVAYAVDAEQILLSTHTTTRKWKDVKENNNVSLVFGFGFDEPNIQCEGQAKLIEAGSQEYQACDKLFFEANPHAAQFKDPSTVFIKVTPSYMRMTEFGAVPPKVTEWKRGMR